MKKDALENDPVLRQFLGLLARDLARHPQRLRSIDTGLARRIRSLVGGVETDLDSPLSADAE